MSLDKLFARVPNLSNKAILQAVERMKHTLSDPNKLEISKSTVCVLDEDREETGVQFDMDLELEKIDFSVDNFHIKADARQHFEAYSVRIEDVIWSDEKRSVLRPMYFCLHYQQYLVCKFDDITAGIIERLDLETQVVEDFNLGVRYGSALNLTCFTFYHLGLSRLFEQHLELIEQNIEALEKELALSLIEKANHQVYATLREDQYKIR